MWSKFLKAAACVLAAVLIGVCLFGAYLYFYDRAENSMDPEGQLTLLEQADGTYLLRWPEGENVERYCLEISDGGEVLYALETGECAASLPELPEKELTVKIASCREFLWTEREGAEMLVVNVQFTWPRVTEIAYEVDAESGVVTLHFDLEDGCICTVSRGDNGEVLGETAEDSVEIFTGFEPVALNFQVTRVGENVTVYGYICASLELTAEDFLGEELGLQVDDLGENVYALSWNETKGDGYLVEISGDGENWETLALAQELQYVTGHLGAFKDLLLRVRVDGYDISDEVEVSTAQQVLYATIWPVQELTVYSDACKIEALGTVSAGTALCVLEESDGMFCVRFGDGVGYIDSNYCMINLPEYLGGLCGYDILNSYDSAYRVHGVDIPQVTDTVITGYENVLQADGTYLVPVLYSAAQKLLRAALAAKELGYRLKIYDSYRPYKATKEIYSVTEKLLDQVIPDGTLTIRELMTDNGRYRLGNFLAPVTSRHNYGVALDLTLETLSGEELEMQTVMHDLSWYSALENNNENADLLQSIMVAAGFKTLESEWWHFQDGEAFDTLQPAYLTDGISAEGWVKDDMGWRYRKADGTFLTDCEETIDGDAYEFDADGYIK